MKNFNNSLFIGGIVAFLVLAGLAWNYTEAIKEKNDIARQKLTSDQREADIEDEFKQKEKCQKLKLEYLKNEPVLEGSPWSRVRAEVVFNRDENSCFLYEKEVLVYEGGVEERESIVDLLEGESIWYPSAGQWTREEFQKEMERLGF